jgi:hypothetical protein
MNIHILVEGPSDDALMSIWARRFLPGHSIRTYPHQGKGKIPSSGEVVPSTRRGLLDQLPAKLRAWGKSHDVDEDRVVVLLDADDDDSAELEGSLLELSKSIDPCPQVLFRIAVEETEAFYFGDHRALVATFPNIKIDKVKRRYVQDSICGTAELLAELAVEPIDKKAWAERIAPRLTINPAQSRSPSFRALCAGLEKAISDLPRARQTPRSPKARSRVAPISLKAARKK